MIHRIIHSILTSGVATIVADPTLLDDLFINNFELESEEVTAIKTYWVAHPPTIVNGYPREDVDFPAVAIILASEGEDQHFIGDDAGQVLDEDSSYYNSDISSGIWKHTYNLPIYTNHPDVTAYYYEIIKMIFSGGLATLVNDGCFDFHFAGGDLSPDPKYLPHHLFGRQLIFSCSREFQVIDRATRLAKAFALRGIAIDSDGSPSDVGGVVTNVTTFTEGE